jgi:hypothetical protein
MQVTEKPHTYLAGLCKTLTCPLWHYLQLCFTLHIHLSFGVLPVVNPGEELVNDVVKD